MPTTGLLFAYRESEKDDRQRNISEKDTARRECQ